MYMQTLSGFGRLGQRQAHVQPGDPDVFFFPATTQPDILAARPRRPDLPDIRSMAPPISLSLRSLFINALRQQVRIYLQGIRISQEIPRYGGRSIGFFDNLAIMAANINDDLASGYIQPRRPSPMAEIPRDIVTRLSGIPAALRGYREGWSDADRFLRRLEETRAYDPQTGRLQPYPSAGFLIFLRLRYRPSDPARARQQIRDGLEREFFPERSMYWSNYFR